MGHGLMYALFAFLCLWGYRKQFVANGQTYRKKALLLATVIGIAYGGLTEIIQAILVPGRTGDWYDFTADLVGTYIGAIIFYLFFHRKK